MYMSKAKELHQASIDILKEIGIEFQDEEILKILSDNNIKVENNRVYFTEEEIKEYMSKAPSEFTIYGRNEKYNMNINVNSTHYTAGYGCAKIREANGHLRDAKLDDYLKFAELVHSSDDFQMNGGILVQPNDIDASVCHLIMMYSTMIKSDKCIMAIPGTHKAFSETLDLIAIGVGGYEKLKERPYMITLVSTLSPLKVDKNALETIKLNCKYRQPMIICPGPMAGATGPISPAGNMAMGNAECIATIALTQILSPGTPIVYSMACTTTDMKSGNVSIGSPGFGKQAAYTSNLAKIYNLPNRAGGGQCDANGITAQAGYETMMNLMASHQEKSNFIQHATGILDSYSSMSFEKFILDLEIISMIKYYYADLEISEKTIPMKVLKDVATNNQSFLTHKHTAKRCRKDPWFPTISQRGKLTLHDTPTNIMLEAIDKQMDKLLSAYEKPQMDEKTLEALNEYMLKAGVRQEILDKINK